MNEKYKRLTVQLADVLQKETFKFILKALHDEDGQDTSDLINLVLSAHLSSTFTTMRELSSEHKDMFKMVNEFIKDMSNYMSKLEPITNVEVI